MEEDGDNASFLDGLVSADTRRRTREQTQPLIDLMCSPACIRPTIVTVGSALLILTTLLVAFSITAPTEPVQRQPVTLHAPKWMLDRVTDDIVRVHLKTLSSDLMEGRGPGTRGEDLAADYIASHFTLAGLKPVVRVNETLSFFQSVPLASVTPVTPPPLIIGPLTLEYPSQYTVSSDFFTAEVAVINMDMVFVGYGIVAPAYDWDDYKGVDVKNKIVVMLVNEPYEEDPTHFAGNTLTYYGRWTYKYEQARAKGALGVILIHTTELAGYGWQVVANSFAGEQVMLTDPPVTNPLRYKGWIVEEAADDLAKIHNSSLAEWMTAARSRNFKPIPLSTRFNLTVNYEVRHFTGKNVVGRLGDDKATAEGTVVMSAHHDHLGIRPASGTSADTIYNGAVDNASGVAALLASAYALGSLYLQHEAVVIPGATPVTPVKSILFVTFTGEESNLLGASYFAANSPCDTPVCNASSALNFDIMNVWGPTYDTVAIGYGMSLYMDSLLTEATNAERISLTDDPTPHLGHLFRSDQLPFALAHIPSVTLSAGSHFIANASLAYYNEIMHEYSSKHYHQPSDEYDPTWSMDGVIQQTRVMLRVAYRLSTAKPVPRMDNTEILPPPIETSSETDDEEDDD